MLRRRRERKGNRFTDRLRGSSGLNMTSMMDILTTLLLFLLKSFVVDGEAMVPPPGIELPASSAEQQPGASLVVAIDDDAILVGNQKVVTVAEAVTGDALTIPALAARLLEMRAQQDALDAARGEAPPEDRIVTIQGDREIEYRVLERVMATLDENGFDHIALAVIKRS
jgi:biopolymer transport protein ExbD